MEDWKILIRDLSAVAQEKKISQKAISELTGIAPSNVSHILSGKHSPSIKTICTIADSIGMMIVLTDKEV